MPPRLRLRSLAQLAELHVFKSSSTCTRCKYATAVAATTPAPPGAQMSSSMPHLERYHPDQPPSHRDPKYRKSQLLRSYVSLLRSTPLIILFQHNNLKASEWIGIRRELATALRKLDQQVLDQGSDPETAIGQSVKIQVARTNILELALRVAEYHRPSDLPFGTLGDTTGIESEKLDPTLNHVLSEAAYLTAQQHKNVHPLSPLLSGSIALLTFPTVSPQYLKTTLSILSPQSPRFPAPTRRANPSYHDPAVQDGLKKLLLLGARIDGQIFDMEGTRWVGSIDGGIDGLRAQLVALLQGFGSGLTTVLSSPSNSLWFTMESRRNSLEDEERPKEASA